jgi:hypothetical protein
MVAGKQTVVFFMPETSGDRLGEERQFRFHTSGCLNWRSIFAKTRHGAHAVLAQRWLYFLKILVCRTYRVHLIWGKSECAAGIHSVAASRAESNARVTRPKFTFFDTMLQRTTKQHLLPKTPVGSGACQ